MGGALGGRHPVAARVFGWSVVALIAVLAVGRLGTSEPASTLRDVAFLGVFAVLGTGTFVAVVTAWSAGAKVLAFITPAVFLVGIATTVAAEPLHWRWSRADFAAMAAEADLRCAPATECRLGWWRVDGSARYDEMVIVWLPEDECYMGQGLAMPLNGDDDEAAVAASARSIDGPSDLVTANHWRDGWYELCFIS